MKTLRTLTLMKMILQVMSFTMGFHRVVQTFWKKHGAFVKEVLLFKLKKKCFQGNSEQDMIHEKGTISSSPQEGMESIQASTFSNQMKSMFMTCTQCAKGEGWGVLWNWQKKGFEFESEEG